MVKELPETMKAAVVDSAGPPENIHIKRVPVPQVKRGHAIIALDYASLGSWDAEQRSGEWGDVKSGTILGADGSGHIAAVSPDVKHLRPGDRVYAYNFGNPDGGFHAEYVSVPADLVERVPEHLDQNVAGAICCVAVTAHAGLRKLNPKPGATVLVYGASGGVGSLAVWLATHAFHATVTGTGRPDAHEYIRTLGSAHAVDPRSSEREGVIKRIAPDGFDALLATASGEDLTPYLQHLGPGSAFAYPNGVEPEPIIEGHRGIAYDGESSQDAIKGLNTAIGSQSIPIRIQEFTLDNIVEGYRRLEQGHVIGKIVIRVR